LFRFFYSVFAVVDDSSFTPRFNDFLKALRKLAKCDTFFFSITGGSYAVS